MEQEEVKEGDRERGRRRKRWSRRKRRKRKLKWCIDDIIFKLLYDIIYNYLMKIKSLYCSLCDKFAIIL